MERTLISEVKKFLGKRVKVAGFVNSLREHGKIVFLDLRDRTGVLQVVLSKEMAKNLGEEFVLEIEGKVERRPKGMENPNLETGKFELKAERVKILAKSYPLPFDVKKLSLSLPKILDWRPLTLRNEKIKAIFSVQQVIVNAFREAAKNLGFFEFQAPTIVSSAAEGGAELFQIDYYGKKAYLAQSPQLYKQILVSVYERVFTVTKAFRAEPSLTTRHLSEFTSLDCEMGFIQSWEEIMDVCEEIIKHIFERVNKECKKELKFFSVTLPKLKKKIPKIKLAEAFEIISKRTKKEKTGFDLQPEDEREICEYSKEKFKSELIFITHYPAKKRPFYTFPDPQNPDFTLSFDLLFRGLEIVSGGQRISDYKMLVKNMKKFGLSPNEFRFYLQAFKYGMPPEGGFGIGLERLTKQILNLKNVKEATLFPRDPKRIDLLLKK